MHKDAPPEVDGGPKPPLQLPLARTEHTALVEQLFSANNDSLVRLLRARLRSHDEAREVLQETRAQMLDLENPAAANLTPGHLFQLAVSIANNRLGPDPQKQLAAVNSALNSLPANCRRAFILVRYDRMNFDEAGAMLGLHPRQVRRFVQRAFASCQRSLKIVSN